MIADEIQSGLARSGKMLACDWEEVKPDVVVRFFLPFPFLFLRDFLVFSENVAGYRIFSFETMWLFESLSDYI